MSENQLTLRTIYELVEATDQFYIPAYQRGYRWTSRQVEDLLNDILEFHQKEKKLSEFYCLQPVVVRKNEDKWELIDGQQRLTTLFIILSFFNLRMGEDFRTPLFSIEYATRPTSQKYLLNINDDERDSNIDFFHMHGAFQVVKAWFSDKRNLINDIESVFLNRVKVIWYEVLESIDPIEVFTRLNIGKIPLTNAELVKALFLRAGNFGDNTTRLQLRRIQIAQEWDDMERALRHDDFWYFLTDKDDYASRIEFLLELVANEIDVGTDIQHDSHYVFIAFNRLFNQEGVTNDQLNFDIDSQWELIRKYFLLLEEWFKDRYWFHHIGYLINHGVSIRSIRKASEDEEGKPAFRRWLKESIFSVIFSKIELSTLDKNSLYTSINETTNEWEYRNNARTIRSSLLLFNVASLLRNPESNLRFQFDSFKTENWDLEHIRSVKSDKPLRADDQKYWLLSIVKYFVGSDIDENLPDLVSNMPKSETQEICQKALDIVATVPFNSIAFDKAYDNALIYFDEADEGETDNSIANLALLDSSTNRSYGNEVFPIKRKRIISLDKKGSFVPLCTKNVFLKYYSDKVDHMMFWGEDDRDAYRSAIVEMMIWFFDISGEGTL